MDALDFRKHGRDESLGYRVVARDTSDPGGKRRNPGCGVGMGEAPRRLRHLVSRCRSRNSDAISLTNRSLVSSDCGNNRAALAEASVAALWRW